MGRELNLLDFLIVFAKNKLKIAIHFVAICVVAVVLPKYYKSQVIFMPQGEGSGKLSSLLPKLSSDFLGPMKLSKRQYSILLKSRMLREEVIHKFNLVEVYKNSKLPNPMDRTLRDLKDNLTIEEEEEGGLGVTDVLSISITAIDKVPQRASDMANYAFDLLEQKVRELNTDENSQMMAFLEDQITECDQVLDESRSKMKAFQIANHAYQVPEQVRMVLQVVGEQKAQMMALEGQKQYLLKTHSADYDGIKVLNERIAALGRQVSEMENAERKDIFPGLTQSLDLGAQYIDLLKEVETYVELKFLLRAQLEQARIRGEKDYTGIYVVDRARPAEYKFKPKRALIVLAIVFVYMFFLAGILILREHYRYLREHDPGELARIDALLSNLPMAKKK